MIRRCLARISGCIAAICVFAFPASCRAAKSDFEKDVKPILSQYCFGCHADGANEGSMSFDELLSEKNREHANERWYKVLKQLQSGLMPPPTEDERPSSDEVAQIEQWIKYSAFGIDRKNPDPGRVTIRRLNRVEYRNTIRDLLGFDYDTDSNFPADDTGHGFDNIGDVLSLSPLLLEKYVNAATEIIDATVPQVGGLIRMKTIPASDFRLDTREGDGRRGRGGFGRRRSVSLSYYSPTTARAKVPVDVNGKYIVRLNIRANESYVDNQFDDNRCEFTVAFDGEQVLKRNFVRQGGKNFTFDFPRTLEQGEYEIVLATKPLSDERQIRNLRIEVRSVELVGPDDPEHFAKPPRYAKFFPGDVPQTADARHEYLTKLLGNFASRAFRRPAQDADVEGLVALAESVTDNGGTFEAGVAKAMTAVLASPQFLFREERAMTASGDANGSFPLIDEYALASRLSYFFWSTMPDAELIGLAEKGQLRANLDKQVTRMLKSDKAGQFFENFVGQWLRVRALDVVQINSRAVLQREPRQRSRSGTERRNRFFDLVRKGSDRTKQDEEELDRVRAAFRRSNNRQGPRFDLNDSVRRAMRRETEMLLEHIVREDRSLLELLDSDYTFLNQTLAEHYEIPGVSNVVGDEMRLVKLPKDSLRGGVLTQGTTLVVTSNPDRTSPVKRGLFVLENLLGTPTPAPPPNVPALEDVKAEDKLSLRQTLAIHRENPLCSSCHNQMDPLGLALENFNALGRFRTEELDQKVDASGQLATGEAFSTINQLKKILVQNRHSDFYRCVTEKLMTYSLGRAVEYHDAHVVDEVVEQLEASGGKPSVLINAIVRSPAFQRTRRRPTETAYVRPRQQFGTTSPRE